MEDENKEAAKIARSKIRREQEERDSVVNVLLNDPKGREYLWWLLSITKVNANPFSANALTTSFSCGEQNIGQQILAHILDVNPAGYVQMLKEKLNASGK
jgi:hypothetical protein